MNYTLVNAVERNRQNPTTFEIPEEYARNDLHPGQLAKVIFEGGEVAERLWILITEVHAPFFYRGTVDNTPVCSTYPSFGSVIEFGPQHVIQICRDSTSESRLISATEYA